MESSFLSLVAKDLLSRYGSAIADFRFIFPNSRTRIFFLDELTRLLDKPLWQPHYCSVDDLFCKISNLQHAERLMAVVELYKCYSQHHKEDFSSFYFWGEMLLTDFDSIDKQLIDAEALFTNLNDLKTIDARLSYLTPEQIAIIKRFWSSFVDKAALSEEKEKFLNIWETLYPIYCDFGKALSDKGLAYTGQMQRRAVEIIRNGGGLEADGTHYVVVGFNALAETEKELFTYLKRNFEVDFYWDYDPYFLNDKRQEAGLFVRENLRLFPAPEGFSPGDNFRKPKHISAVAAASNSLQCKYVGRVLGELAEKGVPLDKHTAIVLADENLLVPLLYSLPDKAKKSNITMGYPLRQSLAYSFTERLLNLQKRVRKSSAGVVSFYHSDVTGILTHPFMLSVQGGEAGSLYKKVIANGRIYVEQALLCECGGIIADIFVPCATTAEITDYICRTLSALDEGIVVDATEDGERRQAMLQREYFVRIIESLGRLNRSLDGCGVEIDNATYSTLIRRVLQSQSVPFEGEPLEGLQIMGVLETRNLDFDNVIILSTNDDMFPGKGSASSSFIPHNLRFAYGMPTRQYQEGVYAYYFYRLIARAKRVEMVYCSSSDDGSTGEQSRFIYQLDYESPHKVEHRELSVDVTMAQASELRVEKDERVMARLEEYLSGGKRSFSPSSFNLLLECPMKFYFRYVAGIAPRDEISEEVDTPMFGTILHDAMQTLYTPLIGKHNPMQEIEAITSEQISAAIEDAVRKNMLGGAEDISASEFTGQVQMSCEAVQKYIKNNILPYDAAHSDFTISLLEQPVSADFEFECCGKKMSVQFAGKMDRMDILDGGMLKIIDYKSGSTHLDFKGLADLFSAKPEKWSGAVVQTLLYSLMVSRMQEAGVLSGNDVCPALYYVKEMRKEGYCDLLNNVANEERVERYSDYRVELEASVAERLAQLFDAKIPFCQREEADKACSYCDYRQICNR